jgi:uridine kinase
MHSHQFPFASEGMKAARDQIVDKIHKLLSTTDSPVVVALDGGSGAGKSTLAKLVQKEMDAVAIPLDDFYSAHVPDSKWRESSVEERLENVFKWDSVRGVLQALKAGRQADWYSFDFDTRLPDGTYGMEDKPKIRKPSDVVLLEGAYSASPRLADMIDLAVLVDVPVSERHARLSKRQDEAFSEYWHDIWDEVEEYYFAEVRPNSSFQLVVSG